METGFVKMSRHSLPKAALLTLAAWIATLLIYAIGLFLVAVLFEKASTTAAGNAVVALVAVDVLVSLAAIGFVFVRTRGVFQPLMRVIWIVIYALVQLGSCAVAGFITLLAMNR